MQVVNKNTVLSTTVDILKEQHDNAEELAIITNDYSAALRLVRFGDSDSQKLLKTYLERVGKDMVTHPANESIDNDSQSQGESKLAQD